MEFTSLFDEASRDLEAEGRERIVTAASQAATSSCWPFLALAKSESEFGHRLALIEDRLHTIASEHGVSYEEVTGPLHKGFAALMAAREASLDPKDAAGPKCANCGHSNVEHAQGATCACGCDSFEPRTAAKHAAGPSLIPTDAPLQGPGSAGQAGGAAAAPAGPKAPGMHLPHMPKLPGEGGGAAAGEAAGGAGEAAGIGAAVEEAAPLLLLAAAEYPSGEFYEQRWDPKDAGVWEPGENGAHDVRWCSKCQGAGHWFDLDKGVQTCPHCQGSGALIRSGDDTNLFRPAVKGDDGRMVPIPGSRVFPLGSPPHGGHTASRDYDAHIAALHRALQEGQDPLAWLADGPVAAPTHHDTTQQFWGTNPAAIDQAMAQGGGANAAENPDHHDEAPQPYTYAEVPQKEGSRPFA